MAITASTPDHVASRQRSRVLARSAGATLAVSSRSPDGAWTSKVAPSPADGAPSNGSWIETGASVVGTRYASSAVPCRLLVPDDEPTDGSGRSTAIVPTRMPLFITGCT